MRDMLRLQTSGIQKKKGSQLRIDTTTVLLKSKC
jgi:hypothetical protein